MCAERTIVVPGNEGNLRAVMHAEAGVFDMTVSPWLNLHAGGTAHVYAWVPSGDGQLQIQTDDRSLDIAFSPVWNARPIAPTNAGSTVSLVPTTPDPAGGIWSIALSAPDGLAHRFRIGYGNTCLFLWQGPGIVASHFPIPNPAISLAENQHADLWIDVSAELDRFTIQAWLQPPTLPAVRRPDEQVEALAWRIERGSYHVAEIDAHGLSGRWTFPLQSCPDRTYLTIFEGLPVFLTEPDRPFPYARASSAVTNGANAIAARIEARHEGRLLAIRDGVPGERQDFYLLPGQAEMTASGGFSFERSTVTTELEPFRNRALAFDLDEALVPETGWYAGDHHMHSFWEDGGQSPTAVVRAARAQHLNYIFLTDVPEEILADHLTDLNVAGTFLAMPGEEVMNRDIHCNALNTHRNIEMSGHDANGNPTHSAGDWIANVAEQSREAPRASIMLNHPSHRPDVMAQRGYFRSWWVADKHPDIHLVENFDLPSWYERLNNNRRITGLWTTDMHDVVFIPPGLRRTYVYVEGPLNDSNIIEALENGHCFNTRAPGALVYLTINGAIPGETAIGQDDRFEVSLRCVANRSIDRIDLVCQGEVVRSWSGQSSRSIRIEETLQLSGWALAIVHAVEEEQQYNDGHLGTPLDLAGCIAFTNPVWLSKDTQEQSS